MSVETLRWRKFSPIDRDFPIYELVDGDQVVLDLTRNERGDFEVSFHEGASGRVFELVALDELLAEAKRLLSQG
jgi:hypothetical protein